MSESSGTQWTIVDLMTIMFGLLIVGAFISVVFSPRRGHGPGSRRMKNTTQVRGITYSIISHASSNKGYYPGISSKGRILDATVEYRFWFLLNNNAFTGEYIISPVETLTEWTTGPVTSANYSYALLEIKDSNVPGSTTGRRQEWRDTLNQDAVIVSDRNTGLNPNNVMSIHTTTLGSWGGSVGWNDGGARLEKSHLLDTRYGKTGTLNKDDNIFEPAGTDDAYMIHTGD